MKLIKCESRANNKCGAALIVPTHFASERLSRAGRTAKVLHGRTEWHKEMAKYQKRCTFSTDTNFPNDIFPLFASQTFICILCNHLSFEVFFLLLYFFDEANFTLMRAHQCNRLNGNVEKTVFHYVLEFRIDFRDGKVLIIEVFTKLSSWGLFVSCVT